MSNSTGSTKARAARWAARLALVAAVTVGVGVPTVGAASASPLDLAYTYSMESYYAYTEPAYELYVPLWDFAYTERMWEMYRAPVVGVGDDYPYSPSVCGHAGDCAGIDPWGFTKQQCVSFVAWRLSQRGVTVDGATYGNAGDWDTAAQSRGISVDSSPRVGDVAHWNPNEKVEWTVGSSSFWNMAGPYGHVAYVTSVHGDGTVDIEEYNQNGDQSYHQQFSVRAPRYIHF
jgi:surface antigen